MAGDGVDVVRRQHQPNVFLENHFLFFFRTTNGPNPFGRIAAREGVGNLTTVNLKIGDFSFLFLLGDSFTSPSARQGGGGRELEAMTRSLSQRSNIVQIASLAFYPRGLPAFCHRATAPWFKGQCMSTGGKVRGA